MQKRYGIILFIISIPLVAVAFQGCSEKAADTQQTLSDAQTQMDKGTPSDCTNAVTELQTISPATDTVTHKIGWGQLCIGGATIGNVAAALFSFSSSTNNQNLLGSLANSLIPQTDATIANFTNAITTFGNETAGSNALKVDSALGYLVKAAALLAKQSSNGKTVQQSDIVTAASVAGCKAATCTTDVRATCPAGMSDADANNFGNTVLQASKQTQGSTVFGNVGDLNAVYNTELPPDLVNKGTLNALTAAALRCMIIQNLIK